MNKIKHPIVFKSAPGAFTSALRDAEVMAKKFRSTNLDFAIQTAIEAGQLFVMPEGKRFAYSRGSSSVSFNKVRISYHESRTKDGYTDFDSPRVLSATYRILIVDDDSNEDDQIYIDIIIPSRFTLLYVERSEGIVRNPSLTRLEYVYSNKDLQAWIKETKTTIYEHAEKNCIENIIKINHRIKDLKRMAAGGRPKSQSAFD